MASQKHEDGRKGFTLIELLIVIGVLGILAGIILVAVDPAKRLRQARDARRFSEVNSLLNAILNYTVDNNGVLPASLGNDEVASPDSAYIIGTGSTDCDQGCYVAAATTTRPACIDLTTDLVDEYIAEIPNDPLGTHSTNTSITFTSARSGYYVKRTTNNRIEVGSCNNEEAASTIKIKR